MSSTARAPLFLREACKLAGRRKYHLTYSDVGREVVQRLGELCPDDLELEEWDEKCDELFLSCTNDDRPAILEWFVVNLPECLGLIRTHARPKFVEGVLMQSASRSGTKP